MGQTESDCSNDEFLETMCNSNTKTAIKTKNKKKFIY